MNEFTTQNPATLEKLETYTYANSVQIESALATLEKGRLSSLPMLEKKFRLGKLAQLLNVHKVELSRLMALEMGKPVQEGLAEIEKSITVITFVVENMEQELHPVSVQGEAGQFYQIRKEKCGILFAIMPWNFPVWQLLRVLPYSFAAGNPVLLKHSDLVAGTAMRLKEILIEALGPDYFQHLFLNHEQSALIIADPRVRSVTMTGSSRAGREVAVAAGRHLKKVVLELGGSDPYLVLEDADIKLAAKISAQTRLVNNGQSCVSGKRFIVQSARYEEFMDLFCAELEKPLIGDPMNEVTKLGPLAHMKFKKSLSEQVQKLKATGAGLAYEREIPSSFLESAYFAPQVFEVRGDEDQVRFEEFFGPVALVMRAKDDDEAVHLANSSVYGLGAGVFSQDLTRFERVAERIESGFVAWNDMVRSNAKVPFGGVKESGFGRELGLAGFGEFMNLKTLGSRRQF